MRFINLLGEHNEGNFLASDGEDKSHLRHDAIKHIVDTLRCQKNRQLIKKINIPCMHFCFYKIFWFYKIKSINMYISYLIYSQFNHTYRIYPSGINK